MIYFVIQGPINDEYISNVIENCKLIHKVFRNKYLISINTHSKIKKKIQLTSSNINIKINIIKDPGSRILEPIRNVPLNLDRQISTSILKENINDEDIVVKIRSDLKMRFLFLFMLKKVIRKLDDKIIVLPVTTTSPLDKRFPLFQVCDWMYVMSGHNYNYFFNSLTLPIEDKKIFLIENKRLNFGVENYLCWQYLSKKNISDLPLSMWDNSYRLEWYNLFSKHFLVLPYIFISSLKYKFVFRNIISSYNFGIDINFIRTLFK